jgi:hypothetical protein
MYVVEPSPCNSHWSLIASCHLREPERHVHWVLAAKARKPGLRACAATAEVRVEILGGLAKVVGVRVAARHAQAVGSDIKSTVVPPGDALALLRGQVRLAPTGRPHLHRLDGRPRGRRGWQRGRRRRRRWADLDVGAANTRRCSVCTPVLVPPSASTPVHCRIHPPGHLGADRRHRGGPPLRGATVAIVGCGSVLRLIDKVAIACLRPVREAAAPLSLATGKRGRARRVNVRTAARPALVNRKHPDIVGRRRRRWEARWQCWRRRFGGQAGRRRRARRPVLAAKASERRLGARA